MDTNLKISRSKMIEYFYDIWYDGKNITKDINI